jgi:glycosidase
LRGRGFAGMPGSVPPDSGAIAMSARQLHAYPLGFHISRAAQGRPALAELTSSWTEQQRGIMAYRQLAMSLAEERGSDEPPPAAELLCGSLLADVMRALLLRYEQEHGAAFEGCVASLSESVGDEALRARVRGFLDRFPPRPSEQPDQPAEVLAELEGAEVAVGGESMLRWLHESNPAFGEVLALFDAELDDEHTERAPVASALLDLLAKAPPLDALGMTLSEALMAPMRAHPDSLAAQLEWVRTHWAHVLPESVLARLALARDLRAAELYDRAGPPGSAPVISFGDAPEDAAPEAFSEDADWMPNVVLMAKSTYVWLHQLSETYGRPIQTLDAIPDEELDRLARWGVTGLWLIGLWERSKASRDIKCMMGNPEAVASAYSLHDYSIVGELGGEDAYWRLKERARQRGIRLAGDMVPNHMGVDSRWVVDHPDRFMQLEQPPYPSYRFTGADLCDHPDVSLRIEDGYWNHSDAAVVFQRVDHRSGEVRYLYHGNDGTSMPWNDTAQLDFSKEHVREAVIQTILDVARRFSIIRFDAAMTLAKKHVQRLWFPKPGDQGPVPSRVEHGMSKAEFDAIMPREFWREVVDRVAAEVPDTLLLAEAFWLMEGYFVRTLGMHRVYNSAFMHMLRDEKNAEYRASIKNVLAYQPAILERFVNFMNNPDEEPAVEQFGRGDKYFGVALLMCTLPGLPMLGHGQIEGFAEKYGMEYRRSYWNEAVDQGLVERHEREIFPLIRRRRLFSGVADFALYDCDADDGYVNENVFATSNRYQGQRALVLYNNAYGSVRGWVKQAAPVNRGSTDAPRLEVQDLCQALGLPRDADQICLLKDVVTGLTWVVPCDRLSERGMRVELRGYQYRAFTDIRVVHDHDGAWRQLAERLGHGGVQDPDAAVQDLRTAPLQDALSAYLQGWARWDGETLTPLPDALVGELVLRGVPGEAALSRALDRSLAKVATALEAPEILGLPEELQEALLAGLEAEDAERARFVAVPLALAVLRCLRGETCSDCGGARVLPAGLRLETAIARAFEALGHGGWEAARDARLVWLLADQDLAHDWPGAEGVSPELGGWLGVNEYQGETYLDRQQLETLLYWWQVLALLPELYSGQSLVKAAKARAERAAELLELAEAGAWKLEGLTKDPQAE